MNLTVVYVVISTGEDIYTEQVLMSIWSCRYYNPDTRIVLLTDENTEKVLKKYPDITDLVNEVRVIDINNIFTNFEKSRILKTQVRQLLQGDLLFVDTDTIFCGPIEEQDFIIKDIAMVEDIHAKDLENHPFGDSVKNQVEELFKIDINKKLPYYNSGVIFYRDTQVAHDFSREWYKNWINVKNKVNGKFDQPSLLYTLSIYPHAVSSLNNVYNVQILGSVRYLFSGKILHFFNANWGRESVHPFFNRKYYQSIKNSGRLTEQHKRDILNCKNLFSTTSFIIGSDDVPFWLSSEVKLLRLNWDSIVIRKIVKFILRAGNRWLILKNRLFGKKS